MDNDIVSAVWPEWRTVRRINRGSYGVVYEAVRTDHGVESCAAVKVISIPEDETEVDTLRTSGLSDQATKTFLQQVVDDFANEIRIMESFKGSSNIVNVEDYKVIERTDKLGWDIFIRMELLTPLNTYISDKTMSEKEVIQLGLDICSALERCAKRNVIHRDIKPDNIFINEFGDFKLGDFGIARSLDNVTGGLSQKGTYNYMAPEVIKGEQYDATVDIYSLGLVLYWLMNKRRRPFLSVDKQLMSPNDLAMANQRRFNGEPLPPPCEASPELAEVILTACNPDPRRRFTDATAMKAALSHADNSTAAIRSFADSYDPDATVLLPHNTPQEEGISDMYPISGTNSGTGKGQNPIGTFGEKEESGKPIIIAAVLVLIFAVVGIGAFSLLNRTDNSAANSTDKVEEGGTSDSSEDVINSDDIDSSTAIQSEPDVVKILPTAVPEEYFYYNGHTYAFYDASRYGFTTYDEVSDFCHDQGGHLAVINDRTENSYLYDLMKENYMTTVFFGYTDKDQEGNWVWDADNSDYENWTKSGDWDLPDNGERWGGGEQEGGEDYAEFNYDRDTNWGAPNDTTWNDAAFMENTTVFFCEWEYDMRELDDSLQ